MRRPHARAGAGRPGLRVSPRRVLFGSIALLILSMTGPFVPGEDAARSLHATRSEVEAAYLYNFGRFIRWPAQAQHGPLMICILGEDPFEDALDRIVAHETIEGRALAVSRLSSISGAGSCAILFFGRSEQPRIEEDLARVRTLPIATVSDLPDFLNRGGVIQFVLKDDRVRFVVNMTAAKRAGVGISSQLLKVAANIVGNSDGGEAQ